MKLAADVVHIEFVEVSDAAVAAETPDPRQLVSAQLSVSGEVAAAHFELLDNTEREGSLTGSNLDKSLSCTMDCDFGAGEVTVVKVLTKELEGKSFYTHFLVLEVFETTSGYNVNVDTSEHKNVDDAMVERTLT